MYDAIVPMYPMAEKWLNLKMVQLWSDLHTANVYRTFAGERAGRKKARVVDAAERPLPAEPRDDGSRNTRSPRSPGDDLQTHAASRQTADDECDGVTIR